MEGKAEYITANTPVATPFRLPCGHVPGNIRRDGSRVPYLLIIDGQGNSYRAYGYTQITCWCGQEGAWQPGLDALAQMLARHMCKPVSEVVRELRGNVAS